MWIVKLALRRPYTFVVVALLILIAGPLVIIRTPKDIFPNIDIPVVSVIWTYTGMAPQDIADRIVTIHERSVTTTVNNIEHIESQSINGIAVEKIFFQPGTDIANAVAQVTAISQTNLRQLPVGTTPPLVITYSASSVPILQLALSGRGLTEQALNDLGWNFVRTQLATIPGSSVPFPYGGKQRQVQVDLDTAALQSKGLSPQDVVNAVNAQNLILPAGTVKMGQFEYQVDMNGSPKDVEKLNDLPIKTVGTSTVYIRDVAHVRDGFPPQTNIVRVNGQRASLLTIMKSGNSSTLDIISGVKSLLPLIKAGLPPALEIRPLADQSIFVKAAISGVVREGLIAACLTGIMILVFLGSWRSTLIIAVSIPLSVLTSIIVMSALGETINIMTLGGLALAVGILVDDATVEIENINRNIALGKEVEHAILDGAQQIAVPALVSTLAICIVFVPMFFLAGVARYLFVPLAEAVVFAMLASYLLSRTLVPTMAKYLLRGHEHDAEHHGKGFFSRMQLRFEERFEDFREVYHGLIRSAIGHKKLFGVAFLVFCLLSLLLFPWLGRDFFPSTDSGEFKLHVRARTGTRIEETARLCDLVERTIREEIPSSEVASIIDNIGIPYSGINLSYSSSAPIGTGDADILVSLTPKHKPTEEYVHALRSTLANTYPGTTFTFMPADIISQILNFGLPAPIDIQIIGQDVDDNRAFADNLLEQVKGISGTADVRVQQTFDQPLLHVDVDRTKLNQVGFTQRDLATSLLVTLSGSFQTAPTYWLDPHNHVSYQLSTQTPQYRLQSLQDLENIPVTGPSNAPPQILAGVASIQRESEMSVISHYNILPTLDIYGDVSGRDLGGVASDIERIVNTDRSKLPRGSQIIIRGQIQTMRSSYTGLIAGLFFSILLVYMLIVVNFQSWLDPFIIITALPAALVFGCPQQLKCAGAVKLAAFPM